MPIFSGGGGAAFNGGTISGAINQVYTGAAATIPLHVKGSALQVPANDWVLFEVDDGDGTLRLDVESNGAVGVNVDGSNGGGFSVQDGGTALFAVGASGHFTNVQNGKLLITGIPTSDPGVSGQVYSVAGVLHISP